MAIFCNVSGFLIFDANKRRREAYVSGRPSGSPCVRPSVRPFIRPSVNTVTEQDTSTIGHFAHYLDISLTYSGITRVGVTRVGNWGCYPHFPEKMTTFFAHRCNFYWFHSGITPPPGGCYPAPFLPIRPRLSTILCEFAHKIFSFVCYPLEGVTWGGTPCDATAYLHLRTTKFNLKKLETPSIKSNQIKCGFIWRIVKKSLMRSTVKCEKSIGLCEPV